MEVTPEDETGSFSIVHVSTRDRPGLLTDIVKTLKDLNVNVISAEVRPSLYLSWAPASSGLYSSDGQPTDKDRLKSASKEDS